MIRARAIDILQATEQAFGKITDERTCTNRRRRWIAIHVLRKYAYPRMSTAEIGAMFGQDHSTIVYALRRVIQPEDIDRVLEFLPSADNEMTVRDLLIDVIRTSNHPALNKRVRK